MKVIFVGIHNKGDKPPLCGSTKSGKIITQIIKELPVEALRTNLLDMDHFPEDWEEIMNHAITWHRRIDPADDDIVVLLGALVHRSFLSKNLKTVKLKHPASNFGNVKTSEYVAYALDKIRQAINQGSNGNG